MTGPSAHLSWKELGCRDGTPYPEPWRATRATVLAREFEKVRAFVGKAIVIGSAYRSPTHNAEVGGARNSQHMQGRALDLYPPRGWTADQLYKAVHDVAYTRGSRIFGLGRYPTFVHMDVRPPNRAGSLIAWSGTRAWAEVKP